MAQHKTLNEYIHGLQTFVEDNPGAGEMRVYYASDDEGNSHHPIYWEPSMGRYHKKEQELETHVEPEEANAVVIN